MLTMRPRPSSAASLGLSGQRMGCAIRLPATIWRISRARKARSPDGAYHRPHDFRSLPRGSFSCGRGTLLGDPAMSDDERSHGISFCARLWCCGKRWTVAKTSCLRPLGPFLSERRRDTIGIVTIRYPLCGIRGPSSRLCFHWRLPQSALLVNETRSRRWPPWRNSCPPGVEEARERGELSADFCAQVKEDYQKWRFEPVREKQRQVGKKTKNLKRGTKKPKIFLDPECLRRGG